MRLLGGSVLPFAHVRKGGVFREEESAQFTSRRGGEVVLKNDDATPHLIIRQTKDSNNFIEETHEQRRECWVFHRTGVSLPIPPNVGFSRTTREVQVLTTSAEASFAWENVWRCFVGLVRGCAFFTEPDSPSPANPSSKSVRGSWRLVHTHTCMHVR